VAVTPSSTPRIEWPCARLAALPGRWVQKCCRGSGYPVFWHRAIRRVAVALSTLHHSEQRSGDGKVLHCANLLIPHLRGNKLVLKELPLFWLRADARCSWSWIRVAFLPLRIDSALPLQLKCSWRIGMPTRSSLTIDRAGSSCHFIETKGQKNRFAFAPSAVKSGNWGQRASALSRDRCKEGGQNSSKLGNRL